jgi:hypothetical protein
MPAVTGTAKLKARARRLALRFRGSFRRSLESPAEPMSLDLDPPSDTLLIAFGGMRGQLGLPPFEFFRSTGSIPVKRLFVRDLEQVWYHRGVPGHGSSLEEFASSLVQILERERVTRLVLAGNSAGGYAALVFGGLLAADHVLAFAPQTVLEPDVLAEWDDHRWDEQLQDLLDTGRLDRGWADLREALPARAPVAGREPRLSESDVFYDASFAIDRLHAERLAGVPGLRLHPREGGRHSIIRDMRASGELSALLKRALLGAPDAALSPPS